MTDQAERLTIEDMSPDCPAWAGELFGELAQDGLSVYRVVEVLGLLDATRGNMTGQAIQGWGEDDGAAEIEVVELGPEVEPEVAEPDRNGHAEDDGDSWLRWSKGTDCR